MSWLSRAFTPPKAVRTFLSKAVRYTGAVVAAPYLPASTEKKAFGLTSRESKGFEVLAKVDRAAAAVAAVVVTGGAVASAYGAAAGATAAGGVLNAGSKIASILTPPAPPVDLGASGTDVTATLANLPVSAPVSSPVAGDGIYTSQPTDATSQVVSVDKIAPESPGILSSILSGAKNAVIAIPSFISGVASNAAPAVKAVSPIFGNILSGLGKGIGGILSGVSPSLGTGIGSYLAGRLKPPTPGQAYAAGEDLPSQIGSLFSGLKNRLFPSRGSATTITPDGTVVPVSSGTQQAGFPAWAIVAIVGAALAAVVLSKKKK